MSHTITIDPADGPIEHRIYIYSEDRNLTKKSKNSMIGFVDMSCVSNAPVVGVKVVIQVQDCSGSLSLSLAGSVTKVDEGGFRLTLPAPERSSQDLVDKIESGIIQAWCGIVKNKLERPWTEQQRQTLFRARRGKGAGPLAKLACDLDLSSPLYTLVSFLRCNVTTEPAVTLRPEKPLDWVLDSGGTGPNGPFEKVNQSTLYYYSQALLMGHAQRAVQVMPTSRQPSFRIPRSGASSIRIGTWRTGTNGSAWWPFGPATSWSASACRRES